MVASRSDFVSPGDVNTSHPLADVEAAALP